MGIVKEFRVLVCSSGYRVMALVYSSRTSHRSETTPRLTRKLEELEGYPDCPRPHRIAWLLKDKAHPILMLGI